MKWQLKVYKHKLKESNKI